jgi:hypothetical protein
MATKARTQPHKTKAVAKTKKKAAKRPVKAAKKIAKPPRKKPAKRPAKASPKPKSASRPRRPSRQPNDLAGMMDAAAGQERGRSAEQTGTHVRQVVERMSMLAASVQPARPRPLSFGRALPTSGPHASGVGPDFGLGSVPLFASETHAFAAAGQLYWQAFAGSPLFDQTMRRFGVSESAPRDLLVVPRPDIGRIDLLVLQDGVSEVKSEQPKVDVRSLSKGVTPSAFGLAGGGTQAGLEAVLELMVTEPNRVVVAPRPATQRLAALPPGMVRVLSGPERSSVGVIAQDHAGRIGVTAALHGIADAQAITVEGRPATILRKSELQDAAFLVMDPPLVALPDSNMRVMRGRLPQGRQKASFVGATSGTTDTIISGWELGLPGVAPYSQRKIYTRRDAQPGDSGSALVTDDGFLVAFAFERSDLDAEPLFCSWIWAAAVFDALQLQD